MELPPGVDALVDELFVAEGVERIVLGGSRATRTATPHSDWDLGIHYRGKPDLDPIRRRGELHPPGSWGRIMNGGAWIDIDDARVDILLRDLDVVDHWVGEAEAGHYEVDHLLGYVAGIPTYSLAAELAYNLVLRGDPVPRPNFTDDLRDTGARRWRYHRDFSLRYAVGTQARGDGALTVGHLIRACLEEGHARACERKLWILNEKDLLATTALESAAAVALTGSVDATAAALEA